MICALREWRCYLEGARFTIVTDHQPNTYLHVATSAHTLERRARWLDVACGYDYTWCYRPGCTIVADPVSRAPQQFALLAAMTASHLDRHRAAANQLPNPRCCAFCQAKGTRNTHRTQNAGLDAGQSGVDRAAQGLRCSDGGGGTPSSVSSVSNSAAYDEQGMSYPAGSAEDEASVECFIQHNFIQRFRQGYQEAGLCPLAKGNLQS